MLKEYYFPSLKGEGWGKFVIDDTGYFSVVSDYGNYAFQWSAFGDNFKEFLTRLDSSYLMGKLEGSCRWFDREATALSFGREIINLRKEKTITKEEARDMWDEIEAHSDEREFGDFVGDHWKHFQDGYYLLQYDHSPQMRGFAERLYPRFVEELKKEIANVQPA